MVMAEEHGMYKGLAPGEREGEREEWGTMAEPLSDLGRAPLLCQCFNSKLHNAGKNELQPEGARIT